MKRHHLFMDQEPHYFMPGRYILYHFSDWQTIFVKNLIMIVKPEKLHFFIDEIPVMVKKGGEKQGHKEGIELKYHPRPRLSVGY